jgi:hypothetical protein
VHHERRLHQMMLEDELRAYTQAAALERAAQAAAPGQLSELLDMQLVGAGGGGSGGGGGAGPGAPGSCCAPLR